MVSYAQNFEDVMLWRALKHVADGFYIDVGANDPVIDSVSLAFYERGWRGVHVEPTKQYADKLRTSRPDERVWQVAIGRQKGFLDFYECTDTGLSTGDPEIAEQHGKNGFSFTKTTVEVLPLQDILDQYDDREIHWLKIDVEGMEREVLQSWEEAQARPWIVVIESTQPSSTIDVSGSWEPLVLAKGYIFAYFDGLNRFYLHERHEELLDKFKLPPNVFDDFILYGREKAKNKVNDAQDKLIAAETRAKRAVADLQAVYNSRSWKWTGPLRFAGKALRRVGRGGNARSILVLMNEPGRTARQMVFRLKRYGANHPRLKGVALLFLRPFPALKARLKRAGLAQAALLSSFTVSGPEQLTPRARQIYNDLKTAMKQRPEDRD
ncbi:MAG: FkbM family methyltransferase [Deltaproteobacteria bacterium]|nr:FkbM family methyltransferase [Deltaproteobacteria bacterium]